MSDDIKEFLHKSTIGLEIEDIDDDENVDEIRQSKILENYGSREVLDNNNNNNGNNGNNIESNDNNNNSKINDIINWDENNEKNPARKKSLGVLGCRDGVRVSTHYSWFSMEEIKEELKRLSLSEELQSILSEVVNQVDSIIDLTPVLVTKFEHVEKVVDLLLHIQKTLFIALIQLKELAQILQIPDLSPNNAKSMSEEFSALDNFSIKLESKLDLNLPIIQSTIKYMSQHIFKEIAINYQKLVKISIENGEYVDPLNDVKIAHSKLKTTILIFPYATIFDKKDIFSLDKQDEIWKKLRRNVIEKQLSDPEKLQESFKNIVKGILLANAMVANASEQKTAIEKHLYQNFGAIYYFFQSQKAKKKAHLFFSDPRATTAKEVLNLMDTGLVKYGMSMAFPSIKYNKKIYINPVASRVTLENVLNEYSQGTINTVEDIKPRENVRLEMQNEDQYYNNLFVKDPLKTCIRILSPQVLFRPDLSERDNVSFEQEKSFPGGEILNKMKSLLFMNKRQFFDSLIIHIHGGGFVAMSSRCHQTYSRQWANQLNVPIFSIDYKKAPEHPYPAALDDVWQAYNWILHFVSRFFSRIHFKDIVILIRFSGETVFKLIFIFEKIDIKPKKVVLVGDSAGGNLVTALTLRCIKRGIRVPDGILIVYPALNLNLKYFTPSLLLALDDQILPHAFLKMCLDSYVPESLGLKPGSDPFISPTYACDELLKELPPTRIMAGTNDPLHDECWRFLQKLEHLKKDVKMIVYNGMPHGFLNYDAPSGMKEAKVCVQDAADFLKELLSYH